jgi:hypothetical protein
MNIRQINRAAWACWLVAIASPQGADANGWTSFAAGQLNSFSFTHAHLPDGRYALGTGGVVSLQDDFSQPAFSAVSNPGEAAFDPSFLAVRPDGVVLVGGGGFFVSTGLFEVDTAALTPAVLTPPLVTMENYACAWWRHPVSNREGWLVAGRNAEGAHHIAFVSADGAVTGRLTGPLSAFSGGMAVDSAGNVFAALADFDPETDNLVLRFDADDADAVIAGLLGGGNPAPLERAEAAWSWRAAASGSMAVDGLGRVWAGGWQIDHLQARDPLLGLTRRVHPLAQPAGYAGAPSYSPRVFNRLGVDYVSFLANDSFYEFGTDLILGHAPAEDIEMRAVEFAESSAVVGEGDGTVQIRVVMTSPAAVEVEVPVTLGGTATPGGDYHAAQASVVFAAGETEAFFEIELIDDAEANEPDETAVITLGVPSPGLVAGLGVVNSEHFELTIEDNDAPPVIEREQGFPVARVGAFFEHAVAFRRGTPTRWSATGLPPGLTIDRDTGVIRGVPTAAGISDRVVITAINEFGRATSVVYWIEVNPLPATVAGGFAGLLKRDASNDGLGGRLDISTTARGAFTARLTVGRRGAPARGSLDTATGDARGVSSHRIGGVIHTLAWELDAASGELRDSTPGGDTLEGWRVDSEPGPAVMINTAFLLNQAPQADLPEGAGFASMLLQGRGRARLRGRLADGTALTSTAAVGAGGVVLIYQGVHAVPGALSGFLSIAPNITRTVGGALTWSKPAQRSGALYRAGWSGVTEWIAMGGQYRAPAGATLLLEAMTPTALLELSGGGLGEIGDDPVALPVELLAGARARLAAPGRITVQARTGALRGTAPVGAGGGLPRAVFQGLLVPLDNTRPFRASGAGFFNLPTATRGVSRSGLVELSAD